MNLRALGVEAFGKPSIDPVEDRRIVEQELSWTIPDQLATLLVQVNGCAVVFEHGAEFIPDEKTGLEDKSGRLSLDSLHGLSDTVHGLRAKNTMYLEQIPAELRVIGDASGGDQVCLDTNSGCVVYWWHEGPLEKNTFCIADNLTKFLEKLSPDPDNDDVRRPDGLISGYINPNWKPPSSS